MGTYVKRLEEVRAIRAEDNLEEIRAFAGDAVQFYPNYGAPYYEVRGLVRVLYVGHWLVKHEDGSLQVMDNREFEKEYTPK
jgi:hypothetical protein